VATDSMLLRDIVAADFLELPATPSTARGKGKTPGKAPPQAATDSRRPLNEVLNVRVQMLPPAAPSHRVQPLSTDHCMFKRRPDAPVIWLP
jgi:hypothetical protein